MRRIIITVFVCLTLSAFSLFSVQADDVLKNCNPNGTTVIGIGDIVACDIDPVSDSDLFTFYGKAGETFRLTLTETGGGYYPAPCLELFDPDVNSIDSWCSQNTGVSKQIKLNKTGTYKILVYESADNEKASYNIALQRKFPSPANAQMLSYGVPYENESISPIADSDVFLFEGVQNDLIRLTLTETGGGYYPAPCLELFGPDEAPVEPGWCSQNTGVSKQIKLNKTGTYTILVYESADNETVVYNLGLDCIFGICPDPDNSPFADVPTNYWAYDEIMAIYDAGITTGCFTNPLKYCPLRDVNRAAMAVFLERGINDGNYTPPQAVGIFDDVPVTHWAADWIEQLYNDGITTGCSQSPLNYCPDRAVNRAAMAVFLLRSKHGSNYTPPQAIGIFDDVPITHWAADWIEQLYKEGITTGCSKNPLKYCPDRAVRRDAMAVFLSRTFGL